MTTKDRVQALAESPFFSGLPEAYLAQLAEMSSIVELSRAEELFHEYDKVQGVYLVVSGKVSLVVCIDHAGCRQIDELGAGEIIGWSPLVGRARLFDTVRAVEPTKLLAFPAEKLRVLCADDAEFGREFMERTAHVLAQRLAMTRRLLIERFGAHLPMDEAPESD